MKKNLELANNVSLLIALALVLGFLYWARVIVIPVALSILLTFLLSPIVTWLQQHGIARVVAVVLASSLALSSIGGALWGVTNQIGSLLDAYPQYEDNILSKLHQINERDRDGLLDKLQVITQRITEQLDNSVETLPVASTEKEKIEIQPVRVINDGPFQLSQLWSVFGPMLEPLANAGLIIVLVCFMLLNREDLRDRVISLIGVEQLVHTTRAFEDAGERVSRYLLMQLLINLGYGVTVGLGLWLIGVPYAALWGFFGALLRYIPYLGAWLTAILPITLSLLISPDWSLAIQVIAIFCALELITNMIVEPLLYGRGMGVSQAALLVCVAFWTWLWGPIGLILASPLTVCIVVLGRYVPYLSFLDTLLGDRPALSLGQRFYQRLLADDVDEATGLIEQELEDSEHTLPQVLDDLAVPALVQARIDFRKGTMDIDEQKEFIDNLKNVIEAEDKNSVEKTDEQLELAERKVILAIPARDATDELAVTMLGKSISNDHFDWHEMNSLGLATDTLAQIVQLKTGIVVVASVYPGSLAHTIYLCKRIRARFPEVMIVASRLGIDDPEMMKNNSDKLQAVGAKIVTHTLEDTLLELDKLYLLDVPHAG
ncbi:AI-2E family transporter [Nitrosomonas sp. JL21]|uniref:AI-2E family transporter n=1 Tax=Nitrosomonas sp. JL21 TaxID=153949 RepID=UPI0013679FB6|nr:AI-2E family transporter [Nitrosomonas sp. JL21]MBL8497739.1 AI-2E family transporter [Nitrosomonas sp.]MXS78317.1 AI-2E family transporter [Nitrosomonas sp. JL21]